MTYAATCKHEAMRAVVIDNREFEIALKRRCRDRMPFVMFVRHWISDAPAGKRGPCHQIAAVTLM